MENWCLKTLSKTYLIRKNKKNLMNEQGQCGRVGYWICRDTGSNDSAAKKI
jgi:hypothetical protein